LKKHGKVEEYFSATPSGATLCAATATMSPPLALNRTVSSSDRRRLSSKNAASSVRLATTVRLLNAEFFSNRPKVGMSRA
jgi:hypothetical protein